MPPKRTASTCRDRSRPRGGQLAAGVASAVVCAAIDTLIALGEADPAGGNSRTACSKGCSYCCHMRVVVTAPEVVRIAAFIDETFSVEERTALARRVAAIVDQARGMSDEAWGEARLPCPLLIANECSVYPVARSIAAPTILFQRLPAETHSSTILTGTSRSMPSINRSTRPSRRGYCKR